VLKNELHGSGSKEKEILTVAKMIFKIGPEVLNGRQFGSDEKRAVRGTRASV
jgi:hypothetical protein